MLVVDASVAGVATSGGGATTSLLGVATPGLEVATAVSQRTTTNANINN